MTNRRKSRWPIALTRGDDQNGDGSPDDGWTLRSSGGGGPWRGAWLYMNDPDGNLWIEWTFLGGRVGVRVLVDPGGAEFIAPVERRLK